jgi:protein-S-isoprenylcysteine O-methyltransferase Ste14
MWETVQDVGIAVAANGALVRVGAVIVGAVRSLLRRHDFETVRFGPVEALTFLEPVGLGIAAAWLIRTRGELPDASAGTALAAAGGGLLVLAGIGLVAWSLWSWRQLFVGHQVVSGQELVTGGAYGFVRHPVYLAALLVWGGLGLAFVDAVVALVALLYVLPVYVLYSRSEERMMVDAFGESYRRYREAVPGLLPELRAPH